MNNKRKMKKKLARLSPSVMHTYTNTSQRRAGAGSSVVQPLPKINKALGLILSTAEQIIKSNFSQGVYARFVIRALGSRRITSLRPD
jgi:hypothetical protein